MTLLTALPLMWGEGTPADVLSGRARRSPLLDGLSMRAIDAVTVPGLGHDVLVIAQPRLLAPQDLVALDVWMRSGGRAVLFTDPHLVWPSAYPLGDPRRAPPITLLDPLLAHWGLDLLPGDEDVAVHDLAAGKLATLAAGRWRIPAWCTAPDPLIADCRIGKGRAILVADADLLDTRLVEATGAANRQWLESTIDDLAGRAPDSPRWWHHERIGIAAAAAALITAILWRWRRKPRT